MHIDKMKRRATIGSVEMRMPFAAYSCVCWLRQDRRGPAPPVRHRMGVADNGSDLRCWSVARRSVSEKTYVGDALALQAEEGRDGQRKATGSGRVRVEPWVSEWGNPLPVMGRHPPLNL